MCLQVILIFTIFQNDVPKTDPEDRDPIETEVTGSKTSTAPTAAATAVDKSIKKPLMDTMKAVTSTTKAAAGKKATTTTTTTTKIPKRDNSRDKKSSTSSDDSKPSSGISLIKLLTLTIFIVYNSYSVVWR